MRKKLLIVCQDWVLGMLYAEELEEEGYDIVLSEEIRSLPGKIMGERADLVLVDFPRCYFSRSALRDAFLKWACPVPLVLLLCAERLPTIERDRIRADYIVIKSPRMDALKRTVRNAWSGKHSFRKRTTFPGPGGNIVPVEQTSFGWVI